MDASTIKNDQRQNWNNLANAWNKWGDVFEVGASHVNKNLFEMAELKPGQRVIDIATGIGEPALSAAKIVGNEGSVVGIDIAEEMIAVANSRVMDKNVRFYATDIESFNVESPFDVALSRFGIMFCPDRSGVYKKIKDSLVNKGTLAISVWDTPDKVPMISLAVGFFVRTLNLPSPPPDRPNPFNMSNIQKTIDELRDIGFSDIESRHIVVPFRLDSIDQYVEFSRELLPPSIVGIIREKVDENEYNDLWKEFRNVANKYENNDGSVSLESHAICIAAKK